MSSNILRELGFHIFKSNKGTPETTLSVMAKSVTRLVDIVYLAWSVGVGVELFLCLRLVVARVFFLITAGTGTDVLEIWLEPPGKVGCFGLVDKSDPSIVLDDKVPNFPASSRARRVHQQRKFSFRGSPL